MVGTAICKFYDTEIARTGLQEGEIQHLGWPYVTATLQTHTRSGYYPGSGQIMVMVLSER